MSTNSILSSSVDIYSVYLFHCLQQVVVSYPLENCNQVSHRLCEPMVDWMGSIIIHRGLLPCPSIVELNWSRPQRCHCHNLCLCVQSSFGQVIQEIWFGEHQYFSWFLLPKEPPVSRYRSNQPAVQPTPCLHRLVMTISLKLETNVPPTLCDRRTVGPHGNLPISLLMLSKKILPHCNDTIK